MGEVYRATDSRLERQVAIKVLPPQLATDALALERFRREARAVAALSHPNIVAIFDVGAEGGLQYAVTELLQGETLRDRFMRGHLAPNDALRIVLEIAEGVAAAHSRDIIHRDLKPENVFITTTGRVKVLDFGLARDTATRQTDRMTTAFRPTEPGMIMGTVGYLAPEQAELLPLSKATDVFALGCILFEAITGRVPFEGLSTALVLAALIRDPAPHLPESEDELTSATDGLIQHCLWKDPQERFPDAGALAAAIRLLLTDDNEVMRMSTQARRAIRRRKRWPFYAAGAAIALIVPAVVYVQHERQLIDNGYDLRMSDIRGDEETRRVIAIALRADAEGNRANATELMAQAHRRSDKTGLPAAFLASWFDAAGNAREADQWSKEAHKRLRADTPTYESLLVRYLAAQRDENHSKELALSLALLNLRPDAWRLRLGAAHLLLSQRDGDAALRQLKMISIERPDDRRLMLVLADRASLGDVEAAERDLERSRLMSRPAFSSYTRGRIAWTRGRAMEAIRHFESSASAAASENITTLEIDARMYAGLAYLKLGDLTGAQRSFASAAARARQINSVQRLYEMAAFAAYTANRHADAVERDRKLQDAVRLPLFGGDYAALRLLAIRMRSEVWKQWPRPRVEGEVVLSGVGPLVEAREAWAAGNLDAARAGLRRARAEAIDGTGFREEAELLASEIGEPYVVLRPDPPYPNVLRYLAIFDLRH